MPETRPSLTTTIEDRYSSQHVGGAFNVKDVLGNPGASPSKGKIIDATSLNGASFQSPNGFQVKTTIGETQLKDAQSDPSLELSAYLKGFDNRPYKK